MHVSCASSSPTVSSSAGSSSGRRRRRATCPACSRSTPRSSRLLRMVRSRAHSRPSRCRSNLTQEPMAADPTTDAALGDLRELLAANDLVLVDLVNRRLDLVEKIKQRKSELGVSFVDPEREAWLLDYLR